MSCIKFPSSRNDLSKTSNKENVTDFSAANSQLFTICNQTFGQGKWSHAINNQTLDFIDYVSGKYQAGCSSIVRVQLDNGSFHEEIGYCSAEGSTKGSAIQRTRLGSYHNALKKTLMCFGIDVVNLVNNQPRRSKSPLITEPSTINLVNNLPNRSKSPLATEPSTSKLLPTETSATAAIHEIETEPYESIPLSQTDALMDIVDLDQLFDKDQNSTDNNHLKKEVKSNSSKSTTLTGSKIAADAKPDVNFFKKETKIDVQKKNTLTEVDGSTNNKLNVINNLKKNDNVSKSSLSSDVSIPATNNKSNISQNIKKDNNAELQKPVAHTVMTDEEIRLERKRKQREMQEEFKRKEEFKKMNLDNGVKQPPNPRY